MLDDEYLDDMMAEFGPEFQPGAPQRLCRAISGQQSSSCWCTGVPVVPPWPLWHTHAFLACRAGVHAAGSAHLFGDFSHFVQVGTRGN